MSSLKQRIAKLGRRNTSADLLREMLPKLRAEAETGDYWALEKLRFVERMIEALDPGRERMEQGPAAHDPR